MHIKILVIVNALIFVSSSPALEDNASALEINFTSTNDRLGQMINSQIDESDNGAAYFKREKREYKKNNNPQAKKSYHSKHSSSQDSKTRSRSDDYKSNYDGNTGSKIDDYKSNHDGNTRGRSDDYNSNHNSNTRGRSADYKSNHDSNTRGRSDDYKRKNNHKIWKSYSKNDNKRQQYKQKFDKIKNIWRNQYSSKRWSRRHRVNPQNNYPNIQNPQYPQNTQHPQNPGNTMGNVMDNLLEAAPQVLDTVGGVMDLFGKFKRRGKKLG